MDRFHSYRFLFVLPFLLAFHSFAQSPPEERTPDSGDSDFAIVNSESSLSLQQGATAVSTITIPVSGDFKSVVSLSAADLPSGTSVTFDPETVTPGSSSTLTIFADENATPGAYTITITGTVGEKSRAESLVVTVLQARVPDVPGGDVPPNRSMGGGGSGRTPRMVSQPPDLGPVGSSGVPRLTPRTNDGGNLIVNGGFEGSLTGWTTAASNPAPALSTVQKHGGASSVLLGNVSPPEATGDSSVYQTISIPSYSLNATLSFWYFPATVDTVDFDWQEALIRNSAGTTTLATIFHQASNAGVWTQQTFDLSAYKGQTIQVYFNVHGDGFGDVTSMYVDDVTLTFTSPQIVNGGFEVGSFNGWTTGGAPPPAISSAIHHGGTYSAVLGSPGLEIPGDSFIYQVVTVPVYATSALLSFWYFPSTTDSVSFDWQEALIKDSGGTTLATIFHQASNTGVWTLQTFDMTPFKGQTVQVYFNVHGDNAGDPTSMYVDDVSMTFLTNRGDFNRDGLSDIFWQNSTTFQDYLWHMNQNTFVDGVNVNNNGANWKVVGIEDFNHDGYPDLLFQNQSTAANVVWYMQDNTFLSSAAFPSAGDVNWKMVAVADFNNDGWPDILWQHAVTGQLYIWHMNGTAKISEGNVNNVGANWKVAGSGDFNGDGHMDILWRNSSTGQNYIWYMNDTTIVGQANVAAEPNINWNIVAVADFSADGKPDILWQYGPTGQLVLWVMNNNLQIEQRNTNNVGSPAWQVVGPR
jgi:FG-GAP-like repeat